MPRSERLLQDGINDIYEAALDPSGWERVCARMADLFGATGFAVQINNVETREMPLYVTAGIDPAAAAAYVDEIASNDPRVQFSIDLPPGVAHHDYQFIRESEMSRHPYYDFLSRWGFRYYAAGVILRDGPLVGNASFQRSPRQGPATPADLELLTRLLPHMGRAVQIASRLQTLDRRIAAADELFERAPFGVALLDARGTIVFLNGAARHILASRPELSADRYGLRATSAPGNAHLQRLIGSAAAMSRGRGTEGGGSLSLRAEAGRLSLTVTVIPLPVGTSFFAAHDPAVLAMISDPEAPVRLAYDPLRAAFSLTPAEFAVVSALVAGKKISRIARERRVALRTVRAQMESIFRKTGTAGQAELLRLLAGFPRQR